MNRINALKQIANDLHAAYKVADTYTAWITYLKAKNRYLAARHAYFGK